MIFMKMESDALLVNSSGKRNKRKNEQCGSKSKLINVVVRMSSADKSRREDEQRRQESLDREEREREARKREQQHEALMMTFMAKFLGSSN
ncbi:hypothetical protein DYB26_015526 [Aphanomyces astaci]|uniref:Uncharacterized protein n=1 Tax=Aphanomyces astaci TaxID=112090 RepID=A0A418D944_APHAT|nr:hypothetical protein DYB26_015526 [Aphanomyces astaci]